MALPHVPVTLAPAAPYTGGLYEAATLITNTNDRHLGGVAVTDPNTGGYGRWPLVTDGAEPDKAGDRPEPEEFDGTIVWAADDASAHGFSEDDTLGRAEHVLGLMEPVEVERHVASSLSSVAPAASLGVVRAVGHLDSLVAANGHTGVIHADRSLMAFLHDKNMIVKQGARMFTPGGNAWAFGAGYRALANTLVLTGPVEIRRGPVQTATDTDPDTGNRFGLAERVVTPYWGGPVAAVTLSEVEPLAVLPGPDTPPGDTVIP